MVDALTCIDKNVVLAKKIEFCGKPATQLSTIASITSSSVPSEYTSDTFCLEEYTISSFPVHPLKTRNAALLARVYVVDNVRMRKPYIHGTGGYKINTSYIIYYTQSVFHLRRLAFPIYLVCT